jgi:ABC-2 type transport system ATP-binding protein
VVAVDRVSLQVAQGEIYALLGLNGAGKTTTIRALLGMITQTSGRVAVLGEPVGPAGRGPWRRVGHLVESPAAYPDLTVYENLEIARRLQGVPDHAATAHVIDLFNLGAYTRRRADTLSLGNLQRLGLARALLHDPELVILDEPANGLDPAGVVEIRALLLRLAHERGVTVFVSSHVLAEVDRLATRIGIIHQGQLVEELTRAELEGRRARWLELDARDQTAARRALEACVYTVVSSEPGGYLIVRDPRAVAAPDEVARQLMAAGVALTRLVVAQEDLEHYFLRLTGAAE